MGLGLSELLLLAFVGILFLKPAELRKAAKTIGHWMGKMRKMSQEFTSEIAREVDLSELRKAKQDFEQGIKSQIDAVMKEPDEKPQQRNSVQNPFSQETKPASAEVIESANVIEVGPPSDATVGPQDADRQGSDSGSSTQDQTESHTA